MHYFWISACLNFLKLCKIKYYNYCLFHSVQVRDCELLCKYNCFSIKNRQNWPSSVKYVIRALVSLVVILPFGLPVSFSKGGTGIPTKGYVCINQSQVCDHLYAAIIVITHDLCDYRETSQHRQETLPEQAKVANLFLGNTCNNTIIHYCRIWRIN